MVELFGTNHSRADISARAGSFSQFAGVRLMTLEDGVERGIRMLEFRTGTGLRFTALVDRALDIADCEYNGLSIGWHSPSGFRHPGLHEYEGEGGLAWLRSFSGLMVTCGLDHILFMANVPADEYCYKPRRAAKQSVHGRVSTIPARLTGYGERWEKDRCFLFAEGIVQQSAVFAENLHLIRRIEVEVGTNEIHLSDRVVNRGFYRTPHMFCYHINVSYPVLDQGSRYIAPIKQVVWAGHEGENYRCQNVGYKTLGAPQDNFSEQVWQHQLAYDENGRAPVALVNDRLAIGLEVVTRQDQFPCMFEWQNLQCGQYAFAIEPSTHNVTGNLKARERGEMIWLDHAGERRYDTLFRVLPDIKAIKASEQRIGAIAVQPEEDFPAPSNKFPRLEGRS